MGTGQIPSFISVEEFLHSEDQHAVPVTEEAVTFLSYGDCMLIL